MEAETETETETGLEGTHRLSGRKLVEEILIERDTTGHTSMHNVGADSRHRDHGSTGVRLLHGECLDASRQSNRYFELQ